MTLKCAAAVAVLVWVGPARAGQPEVSLRWNDIGPRITGKKVALVLPDGTNVQGKVRGVEPQGLRLAISKTSDKRAQPKGLHLIPKQSVSVLTVTDYRKLGRLLITSGAIAAAAGIAAYGATTGASGMEGSLVVVIPVVAAAGTAGIGIGGYYFGKAVDKRVTVVRIVPGD